VTGIQSPGFLLSEWNTSSQPRRWPEPSFLGDLSDFEPIMDNQWLSCQQKPASQGIPPSDLEKIPDSPG
jgi:hypothetical protein